MKRSRQRRWSSLKRECTDLVWIYRAKHGMMIGDKFRWGLVLPPIYIYIGCVLYVYIWTNELVNGDHSLHFNGTKNAVCFCFTFTLPFLVSYGKFYLSLFPVCAMMPREYFWIPPWQGLGWLYMMTGTVGSYHSEIVRADHLWWSKSYVPRSRPPFPSFPPSPNQCNHCVLEPHPLISLSPRFRQLNVFHESFFWFLMSEYPRLRVE